MAVSQRRELEVKFKVGITTDVFVPYRKTLIAKGFVLLEKRLETDFLPDTSDSLCKQNKLLLRIRHIVTQDSERWLLTLKRRLHHEQYQDHEETETLFDNPDLATFEHINQVLFSSVKAGINPKLLMLSDLYDIRADLCSSGFSRVRILIDKYREKYDKDGLHVTLDFFPNGMGAFMELEAFEEKQIANLIVELGFEKKKIIVDDYGDLLKQYNANKPFDEVRVGLFSEYERKRLINHARDQHNF